VSDLPDFTNYSQVDLVQQTIAFLTNRPMYGAAQHVEGDVLIGINTIKTLFTVTGKGIIYGGIIYAENVAKIENDAIGIYVDSVNTIYTQWKKLHKFNLVNYNDFGVWLNTYDTENGNWSLSIMNGITFEENFYIRYFEGESYEKTISYFVIYSLLNT